MQLILSFPSPASPQESVEGGRTEALSVKCVYWKEDKEGMKLEEASAFFRTGALGCPYAHPVCSSQLRRGLRAFPSHAALQRVCSGARLKELTF